jgi:hypothetical protein
MTLSTPHTANSADLSSLISRVEGAEGADREIDWLLAKALGEPPMVWPEIDMWPPFMVGSKADKAIPAYTASLDSAMELMARVLPGYGFFLRRDNDGCNCGLLYPEHHFVTPGCSAHASPALAVVGATLVALQAAITSQPHGKSDSREAGADDQNHESPAQSQHEPQAGTP